MTPRHTHPTYITSNRASNSLTPVGITIVGLPTCVPYLSFLPQPVKHLAEPPLANTTRLYQHQQWLAQHTKVNFFSPSPSTNEHAH